MDEVSVEAASSDASRLQKVRGKPAGRARRGFPFLTAVLGAVAVLLAAAAGWLTWQVHGQSVTASQRTAVLAAARQEALDLTTLSKTTGASDYQAVVSGSAGNLKQQLSDGRSNFLKALSSDAVASAGQVLDAGVVRMNGANATVLLNVSATVTNKQASKPETRLYHWQAALVYSGGRWLVTSLEFV